MREEPVLPRGAKLALALLVVAAIGAGAWALLGSGIDLPDLPDVNSGSSGTVTNLENTTLEEATLGEGEPAGPFTSASLGEALRRVGDEAGTDAELTQINVNDARTQFIVRRGSGIEAYSVLAGSGALVHENASITISGNATISDFAFPLAGVRSSTIDRMLAGSRKLSGDPGFRPSVLSLERAIPEGSRALRWTINGQAGGRYVTYRADADGGSVEAVGGGSQVPDQASGPRTSTTASSRPARTPRRSSPAWTGTGREAGGSVAPASRAPRPAARFAHRPRARSSSGAGARSGRG